MIIKKIFTLFLIGRKLAKSGAVSHIAKFFKIPILVKILFYILGFSFSIRFAFGSSTGSPEYSRRTVVTIKKINSIKIMSGIEAVGISLEILVFRFICISQFWNATNEHGFSTICFS